MQAHLHISALNKALTTFIWNIKRPKVVPLSSLYLAKGNLMCPRFRLVLHKWLFKTNTNPGNFQYFNASISDVCV